MRAFLATLLLATALLAGCTGGTEDPSTAAESSSSTTGMESDDSEASTTSEAPASSGSSTSQTSGGNSTTKGATSTSSTTTGASNNQTGSNGPPDPVSQECAIGGGTYGNAAQGCTLPDFVSSTGASFTKGTVTFTYTGQALPEATLVITDAGGAEVAKASGASPITISLDGKVPAGATVQMSGRVSANLFAGFGGTLQVDLS